MTDPFLLPETYYDENEKEFDKGDPAWAKAALSFRTGYRFGHAGECRFASFPEVKEMLQVFKERFENKKKPDTLALLHAIRYCAEENMPLPTWLAIAFNSRFSRFLKEGGPVSLDIVFSSRELPQSEKRGLAARRDWQIGLKICEAIYKVREDHSSLDSALDAVLKSRKYNVEKTKARALVEMVENNQQEFLGKNKYVGLMKYFSRKKK
jgi:hypothetical protein